MGTPPFPMGPGLYAAGLPVVLTYNGAPYEASGGGGGGAPYSAVPCGYQQLTALSTAEGLTIPNSATFAVAQAEAVDVRWRDDGVAPTATVGMLLPAGSTWTFSGDLSVVQFIQTSGGTAKVNVSYYK